MTEQTAATVYILGAVLVPMVPAVVLFKFLPSSGDASGPLKGLNVKFGGAFAGYLVVFLTLLAVRPANETHYHTWTVTGSVAFQPLPGDPAPNPNDVVVRVTPPRLGIYNQGLFRWEVPVAQDVNGEQFPDLQLDLQGYIGLTIPLSEVTAYGAPAVKAVHDARARTITFQQPIVLEARKAPGGGR